MKKTFEELMRINSELATIQRTNPEIKKTKFGYAMKKFSEKNIQRPTSDLQSELTDIRVANALTDTKTQEILTDQTNDRGFKYSKEGLQECIKSENETLAEWEVKEFDITPFICTDTECIPELTEYQKEILTGVLI